MEGKEAGQLAYARAGARGRTTSREVCVQFSASTYLISFMAAALATSHTWTVCVSRSATPSARAARVCVCVCVLHVYAHVCVCVCLCASACINACYCHQLGWRETKQDEDASMYVLAIYFTRAHILPNSTSLPIQIQIIMKQLKNRGYVASCGVT